MYYYIVNPAAGGGRINKIQGKLKSLLKDKGIDGEFVKSLGKGDAYKIAKSAIKRSYKNIIVVGGDSTVSEVVNALNENNETVLGILPIGTTNILAKTLGINDWQQGVDIICKRRIKKIDLGQANDNYFITSLEVGFETEVLRDRQNISFFNNIKLGKKILEKTLRFKGFDGEVTFEKDFSIDSKIFNISIYNTNYFTKGSEKLMNDGKLTVLIAPYRSKVNSLKNLKQIFKANYQNLPSISRFRAKNITIETGKVPQKVYADAECIGNTPIEVKISTKSLRVIVGKERTFK